MSDRLHQILDLPGEHTLHRTNRAAGRLFRTAFNQVGNRFGLGQVQFVVQKRPLGKLAGPGEPCTLAAHLTEQKIENHRTTVPLKLEHVFAGERVRVGEKQADAFVY